jgi:hypothetical protein
MAASTLGMLEDGRFFSICMENGMLLDARRIIVTAPARHAERLFYTLVPEISYRLLDYRYDTITRVSVGYHSAGELGRDLPPESPVTEAHVLADPVRGGVVAQAGLRFSPDELPQDPVGELAALMGWPLNPDADTLAYWPESDPAMWRDPSHPTTMATIQRLMPARAALAGSDYVPTARPPRLDERVRAGIDAVRRVLKD